MAVKRIWFPNAPSGVINTSQQLQLGIGYPSIVLVTEPEIPVEIIDANIEYYRRYLNDPLTVKPLTPTVPIIEEVEVLEISEYLRRYLNDPLEVKPLTPTIPETVSAEISEMSVYLRRYLNDPQS